MVNFNETVLKELGEKAVNDYRKKNIDTNSIDYVSLLMGWEEKKMSLFDRIKNLFSDCREIGCRRQYKEILRKANGSQAFDLQLEVLEMRILRLYDVRRQNVFKEVAL